jgi:hypothetical protein
MAKKSGLSPQHKTFADAYLGEAGFNTTKAAKIAGFKGDSNTLKVTGFHLVRRPDIRRYIDQRLAAYGLSANEVLARLAEIARGSVEDVLDGNGKFNYKAAKKAGTLSLIKKLKFTDGGIEFELHSAHDALRDIGKYHKMFTDNVQHSGEVEVTGIIRPKLNDSDGHN